MTIGIGSTIWVFDQNARVYDDNLRLIFRKKWRPSIIVGETRVSWILGGYGNVRVSKKNGRYLTSETQIDEQEWIRENVYKISRVLENCKDYEKVKNISEILGWEQ